MDNAKHLNSCIQMLKDMRGDKSNELTSEQQSMLDFELRKLKKLKRIAKPTRDEVTRVVSEVAATIYQISFDNIER